MSSVAAAATLASYGKPGRTESLCLLEHMNNATAWLNHLQTQHQVGTANYLSNHIP